MSRIFSIAASACLLACSLSAPASAVVLFEDSFDPQQAGWSFATPTFGYLGQLNNNSNVAGVTLTQNLPETALTSLSFELLTFRTLDPPNCCTDTLSVTVDGMTVFEGAFSGFSDEFGNLVMSVPATVSHDGIGPDGSQLFNISLDLGGLAAGPHTFGWSYNPLQSFADEAWGIDNVVIEGEAVVTTPEPALATLAIAGLAAVGWMRRRG